MEQFLQEKHAEDYMGTDDNMPDAFDAWLVNLDVDEWLRYADEYADEYSIKLTNKINIIIMTFNITFLVSILIQQLN